MTLFVDVSVRTGLHLSELVSRIEDKNLRTIFGSYRNQVGMVVSPNRQAGGIDSLESFPALLKSLKLPSLVSILQNLSPGYENLSLGNRQRHILYILHLLELHAWFWIRDISVRTGPCGILRYIYLIWLISG